MNIKLLALCCFFSNQTYGLMFALIPNTIKCLQERVPKDVLLIGEFNISDVHSQEVDYVVTDSNREVLARNDNVRNGRFSVVTEKEELYEICFRSRAASQLFGRAHQITLITMKGLDADKLNEEMHSELATVDEQLRRLEWLSKNLIQEFWVLRENEKKLSSTNESTNSRVTILGLFRLIWLLFTSSGQVIYLYKYFKARKIID